MVIRALPLLLLCAQAGAAAGVERTWYTAERIAVARRNVAEHDWARSEQRRILETGDTIRYYMGPEYTSAETFAALSDEALWLLQPTTTLPRTFDLRENGAVCPVHGAAIKTFHVWCPWNIDPIGHPYQIQCMMGKEWYPSNRYHEGDLTSGDYPDDGSGCVVNGQRYHFLAEYAHMVYGSVVVPTLSALSQAYLLTGDVRYGRKGAILMARLATQYPNYGWPEGWDLEKRLDRTYLAAWNNTHPNYPTKHGGMITDQIWSTFMLEREAYAYDALRDVFDDPQVLAFVRSKGLAVADGAALREYIENYILRAGMIGLLEVQIRGNDGHHQAAAAAVALVLDDYGDRRPNSIDLVEYLYDGLGAARYVMVNALTRDGGGHESPGYAAIKLDFIRVARLMQEIRRRQPARFTAERYPDPFEQPKARGLFDYYIDAMVLDYELPSIGDGGKIDESVRRLDAAKVRYSDLKPSQNIFAFLHYGDPRYARAATDYATGALRGGELWFPFPAEAIQAALARPESRIAREARLLDGYGLAILESGARPHHRAVVLNYSSVIGHRQMDQLKLDLYARDLNLLPDLGYPRTWAYCNQWDAHNMAHNTVTIDERLYSQPNFFRNGTRLFAAAAGVQVVNAFHNPYPESFAFDGPAAAPADRFERTVVVVTIDAEHFYVVDHVHVRGGHQHDQSWHALPVEPEVPALDWVAQATGTLAGPEVKEFDAYTDRWGRRHEDGGFASFVTQVRRAPLRGPSVWTWRSGLPEGDAVALHVVPLGGPAEVIMGKGRSPVWAEDRKLDYLFVRRQPPAGEPSQFLTVLDPYQGQPQIRAVEVVDEDPLTIAVRRDDGTDRIVLHMPDSASRTTAHRPVGVAVQCAGRDVRIGGAAPGYVSSVIAATDHASQQITVPYSEACEAGMRPGRYVRIFNDQASSMWRLGGVERDGDRLRLTFDQTALVAEFPVEAVTDDGRLVLGVRTPFIRGRHAAGGATLTDPPNDFYHGVWLGEGAAARLVAGITQTQPPYLHLIDRTDVDAIRRDCTGQAIRLWRYAVGDRIEAACLSYAD